MLKFLRDLRIFVAFVVEDVINHGLLLACVGDVNLAVKFSNGLVLASGSERGERTMSRIVRVSLSTLALTVLLSVAGASPAQAQGFISPFIGYNFGGDAGCPEITDCEDKNLNWGIGVGSLGALFGVEAEFAFIPNFFGETPGQSSSVFTFMGNVMLAPRFGPVQPYGTIGLGLIKSKVDLTVGDILDDDNNDFGWNTGGGLFIIFTDHIGIRGDIRYFHAFSAAEFLGIDLGEVKLDYGRVSGALLVKF